MKLRTKLFAWAVVLLMITAIGFSTIPPAKAQFIIADWDYPDVYWNGISGINIYENSTGSWIKEYGTIEPDDNDNNVYDWNASVFIKLRVWVTLNSTLVGVSTTDEGKNYLRHSVIVTQNNGTTVFSQQNFTYFGVSTEAEIYTYSYDVILDFLPSSGEFYTATVTYEVWW